MPRQALQTSSDVPDRLPCSIMKSQPYLLRRHGVDRQLHRKRFEEQVPVDGWKQLEVPAPEDTHIHLLDQAVDTLLGDGLHYGYGLLDL